MRTGAERRFRSLKKLFRWNCGHQHQKPTIPSAAAEVQLYLLTQNNIACLENGLDIKGNKA